MSLSKAKPKPPVMLNLAKSNALDITINLTTLRGQQQAAKYIYAGWLIIEFGNDTITLKNPNHESA